jgi:hypothetical protein
MHLRNVRMRKNEDLELLLNKFRPGVDPWPKFPFIS